MSSCPCQYKQNTCSASGSGCYGSGAYETDIGTSYSSVANTSKHKSFDLSDTAINGLGTDGSYRQFHQTRIYIQNFKNMISHGSDAGEGTYLITGNLPEQVQYGISSRWEAPLSGFNSATWNGIMQLVSNSGLWEKMGANGENFSSGINRVTTVKIWGGTDPFRISINIPVVDDNQYCNCFSSNTVTNLTECLEFLGSLCLPKRSGEYGFYVPPPSPLEFKLKWSGGKTINFNPTQGRITLQLGGIFMLDNCVLESVTVSYPNTKALIRKNDGGSTRLVPLLANVGMTFSSIEALTSETYSKMLWVKEQSSVGKFSADVSGVVDGLINAGKTAFSYAGQLVSGNIKAIDEAHN